MEYESMKEFKQRMHRYRIKKQKEGRENND